MTKSELNNKYFDWMYQLVCNETHPISYRNLFAYLHSIEFIFTVAMDENRAEDGIDLRYRFGYETGLSRDDISTGLDIRNCSVLEMMIALAIRCEEHIMCDEEKGDRTGVWFWDMIQNLKLDGMDDSHFDVDYVDNVIFRMLNRMYDYDGTGGLFTVQDPRCDMRSVQIWYQLNWHLNEIIRKEQNGEPYIYKTY